MGVTTEPPWVNAASGIAARNGTSSHTVTFGFTPTAGNLLVVEAFGAVTHAASGWTEQLQPVASAELSVFTKTAAGTAGTPSSDTSITITHNGSNYPIAYVIREYYTGSTYVTGSGDNSSADTFNALTGLPGVEVVAHAARGRSASNGAESGSSTAWGGSFVEDADLYTPLASSTEGFHFSSAHQINVTATSITPVGTPTYSGTWSTSDREKVVYAINVVAPPAGTTPVTSTVDLRWQVRSSVASTLDARWQVRSSVTQTADLRWQVRQVVTGTLDLRWAVRNAITGTLDARWAVFNSLTSTLDARWQVRVVALSTFDARWIVDSSVGSVTSTLDLRWAVKGVVTGTLDVRWAVSNQITASLDARWTVRQRATGTVELRWVVDGEVFIPRSDVRAYLSERVRSRPTLAQIRAYL